MKIPRKFTGFPRTGYKPAFTVGYRGWPRSILAPGSVPAPTIDTVRKLEKSFGEKLHVKMGLIYCKNGTRLGVDPKLYQSITRK